MDVLFGFVLMLVWIILYMYTTTDSYRMPCQKVPIGYLDENLFFHHKDIFCKNNYYHNVRTPKMLRPNKKSPMFWIDIEYSESKSFDEEYRPLRISKDARARLSLSTTYSSSNVYMLFSFDPPFENISPYTQFYIIKNDSGLMLITNHESPPIKGTVVAFPLSNEVYSVDHLYTLGRLVS